MNISSLSFRNVLSSQYSLVFYSSLWMLVAYNETFYKAFLVAFPFGQGHQLFFVSAVCVLFLLQTLLLSLLAGKYTTKLCLVTTFLIAASSQYFMDTYGVVIDDDMLRNTLQSDFMEVSGLMNVEFFATVFWLGVIPSIIVMKWKLNSYSFLTEVHFKIIAVFSYLTLTICLLWLSSADYTTFFREYKPIRYQVNPLYPLYSGTKLLIDSVEDGSANTVMAKVSQDAKIVEPDDEHHRELLIMVVGETARADHFQLNGYPRVVNPALSSIEQLVSFDNVHACGTSTAVSVPCMFSPMTRENYTNESIHSHENALDILKRTGVNVLWRDNNSSSKGVADRVEYQDFRYPETNPVCDIECRDVGMLSGLEDYIANHPTGDILIVLHQMGSHGPEYYKRYPKAFEYFKPVCENNKLGECSKAEIMNAYDNSIRYTDFFLAEVIAFLKTMESDFEAGMLYISDHGESLGENGLYLHGLPYQFAPDNQKQVPAVLWAGKHFDFDFNTIMAKRNTSLSHDAVFCTLLTVFEVDTADCLRAGASFL